MIRRTVLGLMVCFAMVLVAAPSNAFAQQRDRIGAEPTAPDSDGLSAYVGSWHGAAQDLEFPDVPARVPDVDVSAIDIELASALAQSGALDDWFATAAVDPESSLVALVPNASYDESRGELLVALEDLYEVRSAVEERQSQLDQLNGEIDLLGDLVHSLEKRLDREPGDARDAMLGQNELASMAKALNSLDFVAEPETRRTPPVLTQIAVDARDAVAEIVALIDQNPGAVDGGAPQILENLQAVRAELARTVAMKNFANKVTQARFRTVDTVHAGVVELMSDLHNQRRLATTVVADLPLVTLDAYVHGAADLDVACPVDWALLAGIGRIESGHGTVDGSRVLASGNVTQQILGPLLDGGATEREDAEALRLAEEAAAIEDALAEEARLIEEAQQAEFRAQLYGKSTIEPEPTPEPTPEVELDAIGRPIEPEVDENADGADEDSDDEVEEEESLGNGFAVIEDSDNGRLDGNDRWDRAVGPMQFIPETWSVMQTDGNDDGVLNPQNIFDAAAAAGDFLCRLSTSRGDDPEAFILGYNGSEAYVDLVLEFADIYRSKSIAIDWLLDT